MFTSTLFTALVASTAVLLSRADVVPNAPGPGDSFTVGGQCTLGWGADPEANPAWKNMTVELMTGSNENMVHLTTVATNQDGTADGTFSYTCPDVSPSAAVFFYQFTTCGLPGTAQWTGRFVIAGADGSTVAPTLSEFFDHTTEVFFGTATMATPAAATAAPVCGNAAASGGAAAGASKSAVVSAPPATNSASSAPAAAAPPASGLSTSRTAGSAATGLPSAPSSASSAPSATGSSAALAAGPLAVGTGLWPVVAALSASAMAFTILL
ncbi:hypothetical protein FB45DRAFT_992001 [Roridomyces roridus]|uniref:Yeast cell wall synthesis Kre9/Knh1-like N-terminal domain-containing protein n=1 Tax=Roridomyces roridus TaxID=1738132 RepID=A0AAD7BKS5_9AGAR|nr:hypothetical protein FB45DRAFT_992001 [Roridomyces roridus]